MAERRQLLVEIERTFKLIAEGLEAFDQKFAAIKAAPNKQQKEKHMGDLKEELKKLQRYRSKIMTWAASKEAKEKWVAFEEQRLIIETRMETYRETERADKTKPFSEKALEAEPKIDPKQKERDDVVSWLRQTISILKTQCEPWEAEMERVSAESGGRGRTAIAKLDDLRKRICQNSDHVDKLELIMRYFHNHTVHVDEVNELRDSIEAYIESQRESHRAVDVDYLDIYDDILTSVHERDQLLLATNQVQPGGVNTGSTSTINGAAEDENANVNINIDNAFLVRCNSLVSSPTPDFPPNENGSKNRPEELWHRKLSCGSLNIPLTNNNMALPAPTPPPLSVPYSHVAAVGLVKPAEKTSNNPAAVPNTNSNPATTTPTVKSPPTPSLKKLKKESVSIPAKSIIRQKLIAAYDNKMSSDTFFSDDNVPDNHREKKNKEFFIPISLARTEKSTENSKNTTQAQQKEKSEQKTETKKFEPQLVECDPAWLDDASPTSQSPARLSAASLEFQAPGEKYFSDEENMLEKSSVCESVSVASDDSNSNNNNNAMVTTANADDYFGAKVAHTSHSRSRLSQNPVPASVETESVAFAPRPCAQAPVLNAGAPLLRRALGDAINYNRKNFPSTPSSPQPILAEIKLSSKSEKNTPPTTTTPENRDEVLKVLDAASKHLPHPDDSLQTAHRRLWREIVHYPPVVPSNNYPSRRNCINSPRFYYAALSDETLMFVFYYLQGTLAQHYAIDVLQERGWMWHIVRMQWFKHETVNLAALRQQIDQLDQKNGFVAGSFKCFDYAKWEECVAPPDFVFLLKDWKKPVSNTCPF